MKVFTLILFLAIFQNTLAQKQKNDTLPQIQISEAVISALRSPYKESSIPFSVATMLIRRNTQGLSLAEDLTGLPGIEVSARYNYAVGDKITNRGFGARTQFGVRGVRIVVDDMPVTFADGQSNLEMIDLQDLSYAELLKGPGSSLYGNASGGVLLLHTNLPGTDPFNSSVSSTVGSNGLARWNGSVGGVMRKTRVSGVFSHFHYNGFRDHASANLNRGIIKLVSTLSKADFLQMHAGYVKFNALNPGSLTKTEYDQNIKLANPSSISNAAGQDGNQVEVAGTWKHQKDTGSLFKMTLYGVHRSVVNPIIGKIVVLPQYSGGVDAIYNKKINILGEMLDWSAGAELAFRFNNRKNYTNNGGLNGDLTLNQLEQVIGTGIFTQVVAPIASKMDMAGSIRYDRTYFGVNDRLVDTTNANSSGHRSMDRVSPSFGVVYRILNSLNIFANVSTSFETPTSTELANRPDGVGGFNPNLNPSHALEYEVGLRSSVNNVLKCDLAGYIINTKDDLIPFQVPSTPGQDYYRNAGSTVHRGGEFSIRYLPFHFLDANASVTYIDAYFKNYVVAENNYAGNKMPGVTPVREVVELRFHSQQGLYGSVLLQNSGKVYADDANTATAGSHTVFDFGIGHTGITLGSSSFTKLIISGGLSNVFNTRYITAVTINAAANRYYEPAPGRAVYLNARLEFGKR